MLTPEQEKACLDLYPYADDDTACVQLTDLFRRAAKDYPDGCGICLGTINKGERHRVLTEISPDDGPKSFRFCPDCCLAMSQVWSEEAWPENERGDDPLTARYEIGMNKARERDNANRTT